MAKKVLNAFLNKTDLSEFGEKSIDLMNTRKRLPAIILVDTSGSMEGYENLLKGAVEGLYDAILADRTARAAVELCVLTFNSDIEILEPLREIGQQEARGRNLNFHCDGVTLTGLALKTAISQLECRLQAYNNHTPKIKHYAPLLFLISDGKPECYDDHVIPQENLAMLEAKKYIRQEVANNHLVVVSVEVGNQCDHNLMIELTGLRDDKHVKRVNNAAELANFFKFTSSLIVDSSKNGTDSLNSTSIC